MDLREFRLTPGQIKEAAQLIGSGNFRYQPYIITDRLEVGTGANLHGGYKEGMGFFDGDFFADPGAGIELGRSADDLEDFRQRNREYRAMYELAADKIVEHMGGSLAGKTAAEIGANAGLHLYNLRKRGAARCVSYEKNDVAPIYRWLNDVTGLDVELRSGFWLNLEHRFVPEDLPEYDIMVSSHVLNHMSDPLHHLAYICDRAREMVFIWTAVIRDAEDFLIRFPFKTRFNPEPFPLNLNAHVYFSEKGLESSLASLGFEEMHHIPVSLMEPGWQDFLNRFHMYVAKRTKNIKSALDPAYRAALNNAIQVHLQMIRPSDRAQPEDLGQPDEPAPPEDLAQAASFERPAVGPSRLRNYLARLLRPR